MSYNKKFLNICVMCAKVLYVKSIKRKLLKSIIKSYFKFKIFFGTLQKEKVNGIGKSS